MNAFRHALNRTVVDDGFRRIVWSLLAIYGVAQLATTSRPADHAPFALFFVLLLIMELAGVTPRESRAYKVLVGVLVLGWVASGDALCLQNFPALSVTGAVALSSVVVFGIIWLAGGFGWQKERQ